MKKEIGILFDCDGVLVDSEPALAEITALVLQDKGIPAKPEDFAPYIGTGEDTYIGEVMKKYGADYYPEIKEDIYGRYVQEASNYVKSFPACLDLLESLVETEIPIAVASSADMVKVKANIKALGFDQFDAIISGSDIERKKPFPDIYLLAAEKINCKPEACIVVEDAVAGIESGNRAGMVTIGFSSALPKEKLLAAGADYAADTFEEIREIIKGILVDEDK